jgi:hypothetical protein
MTDAERQTPIMQSMGDKVGLRESGTVGYPIIGRSGLGNELFPWARCVVWCTEHDVPMLKPQFRQLHIGPYLRRERDKRQYHKLFRNPGYVSGLARFAKIRFGRKVMEGSEDDLAGATVCFEGMTGLFEPILGHSALVLDELRKMTKPELLPHPPYPEFISVHIRRGDFQPAPSEEALRSGSWNYQLPIEWFIYAIQEARRHLGGTVPVVVFSDGTDEQIAAVLSLPHTERARGTSAITDMLGLGQGRMLIASGSTFSMWGSYLGQVPTVWFPGQRRHRVLTGAPVEQEIELDYDQSLPPGFFGRKEA